MKKIINIEAGCPLFLEITGINDKLKSKVVGLEHLEYLIVRAPADTPVTRAALLPSKKVIVKYVYQGVAYGFRTHVLSALQQPANLVFLAYPQVVAEQSLREEKRYNCYFHCLIKTENIEKPGTVIDMSLGGCCCMIPMSKKNDTPHLMIVGSKITIVVDKPDSKEKTSLSGSISSFAENDNTARVGIKFEDVEGQIGEELKRLLSPLYVL